MHLGVCHGGSRLERESFPPLDRKPKRRKRKKGKLRGAAKLTVCPGKIFCGAAAAFPAALVLFDFRRNSLQRIMGMGEDGGSSPLSPLLQELAF